MLTWGCGWHGQTGHGEWQNSVFPKIVKVSNKTDVKFIMALGGAKHTLALDSAGNLWFFGLKSSVGMKYEGIENEKQLQPIKLQFPSSIL